MGRPGLREAQPRPVDHRRRLRRPAPSPSRRPSSTPNSTRRALLSGPPGLRRGAHRRPLGEDLSATGRVHYEFYNFNDLLTFDGNDNVDHLRSKWWGVRGLDPGGSRRPPAGGQGRVPRTTCNRICSTLMSIPVRSSWTWRRTTCVGVFVQDEFTVTPTWLINAVLRLLQRLGRHRESAPRVDLQTLGAKRLSSCSTTRRSAPRT